MSYATPKTIGVELFDQLAVLFFSDGAPSEFEIARLTRDANKLVRIEPGEGLTILSAIEALKWNTDASRQLIKRAIVADDSVLTHMNAALTLRNICLMDEACEHMRIAASYAPSDSEVISRTRDFLCMAGRFEESASVMSDANRRGIKLTDDDFDAVAYAEALRVLEISTDRLVFELQCAYRVLADNKRRPRGFGVTVADDPDGGQALVVAISVLGSLEDEMHFESELALLLSSEDGWDPCKLSMEFECMPEDAYQHA